MDDKEHGYDLEFFWDGTAEQMGLTHLPPDTPVHVEGNENDTSMTVGDEQNGIYEFYSDNELTERALYKDGKRVQDLPLDDVDDIATLLASAPGNTALSVTYHPDRPTYISDEYITAKEVKRRLGLGKGKVVTNYATKEKALFNRTQIDKMLSNKATGKSLANGFSISQHNQAALHIVELYRNARALPPREDREGDPNVESVRIFIAPIVTIKDGGQADAEVYITVKRAAQQHKSEQTRNRIYSLELLGMELRHIDRGGRLANNQALSRPQPSDTISNPGGDVKPQPGLITIPPQNTALSVGDLHTGARVAYGKPDSKFIGSGEGAQVYGWGHYSSGVKGVARDEYAMRYVEDFQERSKVQYKGDPKSAVSIGGVVYDNVVDFAYEASRIEEAIHNKLQNHEKIEKDEEGNFVVGDKTVPKELLTFIAATRTALVDAQTVFSAWTGKAVPKDYRDPEFYRIARYRAKSEQDSVLPMSRFYGEMMLRGPLKSKKAWAAFVDSFFPKMERLKPEGPLPAVMTQTWWTHRPEGDESHLLNWFEPIEGDNREIVIRAIEGIASDYNWDDEVLDGEFGEDWRDREDLTGEEVYEGVANLIYKDTFDFEKSRQWASEGLYAHDIDGVKYPVDSYFNDDNRDGNKGWNYVAFSDEHLQVDSVEEWNPETLSFEPRPVPGNVAFSVGERPGRAPTVESGGDVREAGEGALAWLRRKFVHSQTPVFDAVRRVMGVGREPPDALNVEAAAKNVHGKIRARQEMLQRAYLEPLKAILAQPGMDRKRFDDYALALHALERNRMIQERSVVVDPTTGEVVDLGVEAGSGVTNAWAERVIREVERDPFAAQYKEAANILAEMNRFVLRGAVADGLLTEAQARTWMRLSPHYVPLKSGGAAPGAIHKRATGRFTRPDSVLVNSMRQAYATVRNGELNRVNKTMADWIREYDPNGEQVGGTVPESHKHAKIKRRNPKG